MRKVKRREFMMAATAAGLTLPAAAGCSSLGAAGAPKAKGPNLLFVLVDGWHLVVGTLMRSFA